jgi:hypothetical protein
MHVAIADSPGLLAAAAIAVAGENDSADRRSEDQGGTGLRRSLSLNLWVVVDQLRAKAASL